MPIMNRSDHTSEQQMLTLQQALDLGLQNYTAGDMSKAEDIYQQILQTDPNNPVALHLLGVITHHAGRSESAVDLIKKALTVKPDYAEAYTNVGNVLQSLGKLEEAMENYQKAISIKSNYPLAHNNLGNALQELERPEDALLHYHKAIEFKPDYVEVYNNLGNVFKKLGRLKEAVTSYHKALAIKPDYVEAHKNLGNVFVELGQLDDAVASYNKTLAIKPDSPDAHNNLAIILNMIGRRSEALVHFKKSLEIERGDNPINSEHIITKVKIIHDIEQFRYLASQKDETERFLALVKVYEAVESEIEWPNDDKMGISLSDHHRKCLGATYNRPFHLLEAPEVTGSTLSNTLDVDKITADYFSHTTGMTYFDDLLNPNSLASLRRFLLGSTIWSGVDEHGGILGTRLKDGLACPLLFQIADDLRQNFPAIFKDHQLTQLWAYKYDSHLRGSSLHADFAAINVNFWITPDTANLNPASGGLVVYEAEAPLDWNFKSYLRNPIRIREFLTENDSGKTIVPYGGNRTVLFNSRLFHETDTLEFKQGYENRRINVTWLFGNRYV